MTFKLTIAATGPLWLLGLACTGKTPVTDDSDTDSQVVCDTGPSADTGFQIGVIDPICRCEDPTLVIGSGEHTWADLPEGSQLEMVHGPQGGWHMLGSAKLCNTRNVATIHFTITDNDSSVVVSDNTYRVALVTEEDSCCGYYPGMYGFLSVSDLAEGELNTPPELLACHEVTLTMETTDSGGHSQTESTIVTAIPDPDDSTIACP